MTFTPEYVSAQKIIEIALYLCNNWLESSGHFHSRAIFRFGEEMKPKRGNDQKPHPYISSDAVVLNAPDVAFRVHLQSVPGFGHLSSLSQSGPEYDVSVQLVSAYGTISLLRNTDLIRKQQQKKTAFSIRSECCMGLEIADHQIRL